MPLRVKCTKNIGNLVVSPPLGFPCNSLLWICALDSLIDPNTQPLTLLLRMKPHLQLLFCSRGSQGQELESSPQSRPPDEGINQSKSVAAKESMWASGEREGGRVVPTQTRKTNTTVRICTPWTVPWMDLWQPWLFSEITSVNHRLSGAQNNTILLGPLNMKEWVNSGIFPSKGRKIVMCPVYMFYLLLQTLPGRVSLKIPLSKS